MQRLHFVGLSLTLLLGLASCTVSAQSNPPRLDSLQSEIRGMIRHSLIHWLEPLTPSANIGVDYRINDWQYLRHEVGLIIDMGYGESESLRAISGFRFRTAYRKYHQAPRLSRRLTFLEFSLDYRYVDATIAGDFRREFGAFRQRINYQVWHNNFALNVVGGISRGIGEHWRLDLGIGAGIRLNYRNFSEIPEDASYITNGDLWLWDYAETEGVTFGLNMPIIIAIAYQW